MARAPRGTRFDVYPDDQADHQVQDYLYAHNGGSSGQVTDEDRDAAGRSQ